MTESMMTLLVSGAAGFCLQIAALETIVLAGGLAVARSLSHTSRPARYLVLQITLIFALMTPLLAFAVHRSNLGLITRPVDSDRVVVATGDASTGTAEGDLLSERMKLQTPRGGLQAGQRATRVEEVDPVSAAPTAEAVESAPESTRFREAGPVGEAAVETSAFDSHTDTSTVMPWIGRTLLGVWLLVATSLLLRMLYGYREIRRLQRLLRAVDDPRSLAILDAIVAETAIARAPRLMTSPTVPVPMTIGLLRPVIALPSALLDDTTDATTLKAILLHETAHIARRDLATALLERLAMAFYWWHPLVHHLCRRMDDLREDICDNWAVRAQGQGETLARCLVDLAAALCAQRSGRKQFALPQRLTVGALGLDSNGLQRRVARLLRLRFQQVDDQNSTRGDETMIRTTWRIRIAAGLFTLLLLGMFVATGVRQVPAENPRPTRDPAEEAVTRSSDQDSPTLTGTVVDPSGGIVRNARVWLAQPDERWPEPVLTDETGRFSIQYDRPDGATACSVWAESADGTLAGAERFVDPGSSEKTPLPAISVQLGATRSVTVHVSDADGRPIAGADVELFPDSWQHSTTVIPPRTNAEGTTLVQLPENVKISYVLAIKPGQGLDYFVNCSRVFRAKDTIPDHIDLCLRGATTVRLKVEDTKGRPIPHLPFSAIGAIDLPGRTERFYSHTGVITKTSTDENGQVVFDWLPDGAVNDYFTLTPRTQVWSTEEITVVGFLTTPETTLVLKRRQTISGRITLPDGQPAEGAIVGASGTESANKYRRAFGGAKTGKDGTYCMPLDSGKTYILDVQHEGWATAYRMPVVVEEDKPAENVDFQLSKGTLVHGTVRVSGDIDNIPEDARGTGPSVVAKLVTTNLPEPFPGFWKFNAPRSSGSDRLEFHNGKGEYAFRLGPGDYQITLQLPGNVSQQVRRDISVADQDEVRVDLEGSMPDNRQLQFRTVLAANPEQGVPDVVIRYDAHVIHAWVGEYFVTGEKGECTYPTTGQEQFLRGRTEDLRLGGKATIDGKVTSVTIPMAPTATVRGRFVDADGTALAGKKVEVRYQAELEIAYPWFRDNEIAVRTDASGHFEMPGLIAGIECRINLADHWQSTNGRPTNGKLITPKPGEAIDLGEITLPKL